MKNIVLQRLAVKTYAFHFSDITATFNWFDKNGDGKIDVKEMGIALRLEGQNPTEKEIQDMVDAIDLNGMYYEISITDIRSSGNCQVSTHVKLMLNL